MVCRAVFQVAVTRSQRPGFEGTVPESCGGGGGDFDGGFFLACEDFGGKKVRPFIPRLRFFFFFFEVEISSRTLIPLFRPGSVHSGSAS